MSPGRALWQSGTVVCAFGCEAWCISIRDSTVAWRHKATRQCLLTAIVSRWSRAHRANRSPRGDAGLHLRAIREPTLRKIVGAHATLCPRKCPVARAQREAPSSSSLPCRDLKSSAAFHALGARGKPCCPPWTTACQHPACAERGLRRKVHAAGWRCSAHGTKGPGSDNAALQLFSPRSQAGPCPCPLLTTVMHAGDSNLRARIHALLAPAGDRTAQRMRRKKCQNALRRCSQAQTDSGAAWRRPGGLVGHSM